jgi:shikimate kinase
MAEVMKMAEVNGPQAAEILSMSIQSVHRKVDAGALPARQQGTGVRQFIFIDIDDLRKFAQQYGYRFNEELAARYAK